MIAKFKAKRIDNGEWVYGYYFLTPLTDESTPESMPEDGWFFLVGKKRHCISKNSCVYEVDEKTVCHFTQSLDTENNEIYDGDKIQNENGIVAVVYWHEEYLAWYVKREDYDYVTMPLYKFKGKVIGNINEDLK